MAFFIPSRIALQRDACRGISLRVQKFALTCLARRRASTRQPSPGPVRVAYSESNDLHLTPRLFPRLRHPTLCLLLYSTDSAGTHSRQKSISSDGMNSKREQALVGLFVLVAGSLLIATVFMLSGKLGRGGVPYHTYFKNAGGLAPGSEVRYAGGPPVGRVEKVSSAPTDPTHMEVDFVVDPGVPVKTDSTATITSISPLGDNFLGILPGTAAAARAAPGATLKSSEYISLASISPPSSAGWGPTPMIL